MCVNNDGGVVAEIDFDTECTVEREWTFSNDYCGSAPKSGSEPDNLGIGEAYRFSIGDAPNGVWDPTTGTEGEEPAKCECDFTITVNPTTATDPLALEYYAKGSTDPESNNANHMAFTDDVTLEFTLKGTASNNIARIGQWAAWRW
jgi:hypothetical protein